MAKSSITLEPETTTIGAPVRIRVDGTEGPVTAKYDDLNGLRQTFEPDENGIVMASFQYSGEVIVSAKRDGSKGTVKETLTVL